MGEVQVTRTPEEREQMYALITAKLFPDGISWAKLTGQSRAGWVEVFDAMLEALPSAWNDLPPDPAATARKEAEEDGRTVKNWRSSTAGGWLSASSVVKLITRMERRAAAGYPALIAPKGEK